MKKKEKKNLENRNYFSNFVKQNMTNRWEKAC